jgi:hypothetical protein
LTTIHTIFDEMLDATDRRLRTALEVVEMIDDPYPGPDLVSVAIAIADAVALIETLRLLRNSSKKMRG